LLRSSGSFANNTVLQCLATNSAATAFLPPTPDTTLPAAGNAFYYLVRGQASGYSANAAKERGTGLYCNLPRPRNTELATNNPSCP
jgi:hypothetical protein